MSVFLTLRIPGDPQALEQYAKDNQDVLQGIMDAATRHGVIAHRFYGSEDGASVLVLDEWPDRESFEAFFQEQQEAIQPVMAGARVTGEPQPEFWHELRTGDAYGWGA